MTYIQDLRAVLNTALDTLEEEIEAAGMPPLALDDATPHPLDDTHGTAPSARLVQARKVATSALTRLRATVEPRVEQQFTLLGQVFESAALRFLSKAGVADALVSTPGRAKTAEELSHAADVDVHPGVLARMLRQASLSGWVNEVDVDVFAPTRLTSALCRALPMSAWLDIVGKYTIRAAGAIPECLLDPQWRGRHGRSEGRFDQPFQYEYGVEHDFYAHIQANPDEVSRFANAMEGASELSRPSVLADIPWVELCGGKTMVDVGGGKGSFTAPLAAHFPGHFRLVVQDRKEVVPFAAQYLQATLPEEVRRGDALAEFHDFFTPQVRRGAEYIYVMRYVLHTFHDVECVRILQATREAMVPSSQLLICETLIVPGADLSSKGESKYTVQAPEGVSLVSDCKPLPDNLGRSLGASTMQDLLMFTFNNARERTLADFDALLAQAHMRISTVYLTRSYVVLIVATPV